MANAYGMDNGWRTWRTCHVTEAGIDIMSEPRECAARHCCHWIFKKITQMHAFRAYIFAIV